MKRNITLACVCGFVILAGRTSPAVEYISADVPVSLADGKITFKYDGNGSVTRLRMTPVDNEVLELSGDEISFADGAQIITGQSGDSRIACAIDAAGPLMLGVTNMLWYTGTRLTANSYTTMFRGVRLDDISPILSCTTNLFTSMSVNINYYPYHVRRSGDKMNVEFQAKSGAYIKGVHLELKQDGDDIVGKVLAAGHFGNNNTIYLGFRMFDNPTVTVNNYTVYASDNGASTGYGIGHLLIGPRRETYEYSGNLISNTSPGTVVATGTRVEDLEILYGVSGHNRTLASMARATMYPSRMVFADGVLSAQLINTVSSTYVQCVKVELRQSGSDIVARSVYARYISIGKYSEQTDFDDTTNPDIKTHTVIQGDSYSTYGYNIDMLVLRRKNRGNLTFHAAGPLDVPAVSGSGINIVFDTNPEGAATEVFRSGTLLCGTDWTTLATGRTLSGITLGAGRLAGSRIASEGLRGVVAGWTNDGQSASGQMQVLQRDALKAIDFELRQGSGVVEIRCLRTISLTSGGSAYYGRKKLTVSDVDADTSAPLVTSADGDGYALLDVDSRKPSVVYASGANSMTDSAYVIKGDEAHPIEFCIIHKDALPTGTTDVFGDAELSIKAEGVSRTQGVSNGRSAITMHPGSRLRQESGWSFNQDMQKIFLDGGALYAQYQTDGITWDKSYVNYLVLSNSATVHGGTVLAVNAAPSPTWHVCGTGASVSDANISIYARGAYGTGAYGELTIRVDDTVAGADADFIMNGDILPIAQYPNAAFAKYGAGTMQMNGTISTTNKPTRVVEGTLLLGASNTTVAGHGISLEGGALALAEGTVNEMSSLTVKEPAVVSYGNGAKLVLADLVLEDGANLVIDGGFPRNGLKVAQRLDADTLAGVRIGGKIAVQTDSGFVRTISGISISFH